MKKHMRQSDGKYHINGKKYDVLIGSRTQVQNETAYKTSGGLKKKDLHYNKKTGRHVSLKKHNLAKKERRLEKYGYFTQKGKFGAVKRDGKKSKRHAKRSHKRTLRRVKPKTFYSESRKHRVILK